MNVHYSELSEMPDPQHRMASDYLMLRGGAIAALDSESKISPLSSPLDTSPGS
jgi:hypothetical protein